MDRLAPTITDNSLLALLGGILGTDPTSERTSSLRLRFFRPDFSWQALVDFAVAQDVLPALIYALNRRGLLPPVPATMGEDARIKHVTTRLTAAYHEHLARQADLRDQLATILRALNRQGIVPVILKGAVHLTMNTGWHEARSMRDIDILTRSSDAQAANQILLSIGYRGDPDPPPLDRHLPELRLSHRSGAVEIHTEALAFSARRVLTTEEVWMRAEAQTFAGTSLRVLPPQWHLLHGMLHHQIADRGHARRLLAIKGLWEFAMVGSGLSPQAWNAIVEHAGERGVLDVLASWVAQANRLFGLKIPDGLRISEKAHRHAEATLRRARAPYAIRWTYFTGDRLRFAFSRETLAVRYGLVEGDNLAKAAQRHVNFLMRSYWSRAAQWLRRQR